MVHCVFFFVYDCFPNTTHTIICDRRRTLQKQIWYYMQQLIIHCFFCLPPVLLSAYRRVNSLFLSVAYFMIVFMWHFSATPKTTVCHTQLASVFSVLTINTTMWFNCLIHIQNQKPLDTMKRCTLFKLKANLFFLVASKLKKMFRYFEVLLDNEQF